jgi:hypothetical protein
VAVVPFSPVASPVHGRLATGKLDVVGLVERQHDTTTAAMAAGQRGACTI